MTADLALVKKQLDEKDYVGLEARLAQTPTKTTAALWPRLSPLEKLTAFKLLDATRAMELFEALPFDEKYFLFCGFPLQAAAPALEGLAAAQRRAFVSLRREDYDRMFRRLLSESPERAAAAR